MRETIAELESFIIKEFRPIFFSIHSGEVNQPNVINIVISIREFSNMSVDKRVATLYKKIKDHNPKLLEKYPVIIQTFSSSEMVELFEYIK